MNQAQCLEGFAKAFGDAENARVFFAPGRVNLIGEHTDYNGGHVFPCALSMGTYIAIRKREDRKLRFFSENFSDAGIYEFSLDTIAPRSNRTWTAYPCGVIWAMAEEGNEIPFGFDMWVYGNIPNGSGLSSSASLEVVTGYALGKLYAIEMTNDHIALLGQKAENGYVGMNCGIMDQFAVAMGKAGCAIYLNTATLEYQYAPLALDGLDILIMDTRKKRGLKDSKYNDRVKECTAALEILRRYGDAPTLCEADEELLAKAKADMPEEIYRRARHAITEDIRTQRAVDALEKNDIAQFGQLMNASHASLEADYEVTGKELDSLVHNAWDCEGVIGARMTGAGFGGCAVALVRSECTEAIKAHVAEIYHKETGLTAAFYIAAVGNGPMEVID